MIKKMAIATLVGAAFAATTPAHAQDAPKPASEAQARADVQAPAEGPQPAALSNAELDQLRGGESVVVTNQTLVAITSGNVINGNYTAGDVSLSDFALSNFNGLGNLLINTGAQVSLQTGMNVTINVKQ